KKQSPPPPPLPPPPPPPRSPSRRQHDAHPCTPRCARASQQASLQV
ncbi:hypothetical protein G3N93_26680, partial [Burkholderia sp. Se-20378]|nr:hypothetical protein [Burkholderia sp. Se-20378]